MSRLTAKFLLVALVALSLGVVAEEFRAVTSTDKLWRPEGAQLTLEAALRVAEAEALRNHIRFGDYLTPQFRYSHDKTQGYIWVFLYDGKVPMPGNNFGVVVNDRTRQAVFMAGE